MHIHVPEKARQILCALNKAGFSAYLVGGCVRDALLGRAPSDWDIATSARPEETARLFPDHAVVGAGLRHGTIAVLMDGELYEVTTFREDGVYLNARSPEQVAFIGDLRADLMRRDFTVNALAYHPESGLVDYFNGCGDMRAKQIVCVGDPSARFGEDALRILRAIRFASVLDFEIAPETAQAMREQAQALGRISGERIRAELDKCLLGAGARRALAAYADVLCAVFPALAEKDLAATAQAVALSPQDLPVRLALFLQGSRGAGAILRVLRYPKATHRCVERLLREADEPIPLSDGALRKLLNRLGEEDAKRLLALWRVQIRENRRNESEIDFAAKTLEKIIGEGQCYRLSDLAVNGDDLTAAGVQQGKATGELLRALLARVMDGDLPNERSALTREARRYQKQKGADSMKTIEEIRAFFVNDRFATAQGMEIDSVEEGGAVCSVALRDDHNNAAGVVQGGLVFTLADFAFAVAANHGEETVVTLDSTIHFLRASRGGRLTATASCDHKSRTICLYRVDVRDDSGALVAKASITGYRKTPQGRS